MVTHGIVPGLAAVVCGDVVEVCDALGRRRRQVVAVPGIHQPGPSCALCDHRPSPGRHPQAHPGHDFPVVILVGHRGAHLPWPADAVTAVIPRAHVDDWGWLTLEKPPGEPK